MSYELSYDSAVQRFIRGFSVIALGLLIAAFAPAGVAQIHGVPTSVTSIGFGGQWNQTPGVPASVTSLGPNGFHSGFGGGFHHGGQFPQPGCCMSPLFPIKPNPGGFGHHHHRRSGFVGAYPFYSAPVYSVPYTPYDYGQDEDPQPEEYPSGPTVFDRRGSALSSRDVEERYESREPEREQAEAPAAAPAPEPQPVIDEPQTVLVFKDGHQLEVQNYAVLGGILYDLTPGHHRKVQVSELDVQATVQQNDDRGIDFRLPPGTQLN